MSMIQQALAASHCIVSYIGAHAGEGVESILARKIGDIQKVGHTFWVFNAYTPTGKFDYLGTAFLDKVHEICGQQSGYVVFVNRAAKGRNGTKDTATQGEARVYSADGMEWQPFDARLSAVKGKIPYGRKSLGTTRAFTFGQIESASGEIDMGNYTDALRDRQPIDFGSHCATCIASVQSDECVPPKLNPSTRRIVAVGKLAAPYCVYVSQQ